MQSAQAVLRWSRMRTSPLNEVVESYSHDAFELVPVEDLQAAASGHREEGSRFVQHVTGARHRTLLSKIGSLQEAGRAPTVLDLAARQDLDWTDPWGRAGISQRR